MTKQQLKKITGPKASRNKHQGHWAFCKFCDKLVAKLERDGLSTGDAQGVAMCQHEQAIPRAA
jgi:hypothetical protein